MSAIIPPERHNPKAWANYGCKDTIIFGEMQENGEKIDIFSLEAIKEIRHSCSMGTQVDTPIPNERV